MEIHDHLLSFTFDLAHSGNGDMIENMKTPKTPSGGQTWPHRDANIHQHRQKEMGKIKNVMTYKKGKRKLKTCLLIKYTKHDTFFLGWHFWE